MRISADNPSSLIVFYGKPYLFNLNIVAVLYPPAYIFIVYDLFTWLSILSTDYYTKSVNYLD